MTLRRHIQVMKVTFRTYTSLFASRRHKDPLDKVRDLFMNHGIKIDTNEHNRKLTINIEFLCG